MPDSAECNIYHEDCLDGLGNLPEGSIDCIVTDPPYGISYLSNRRTHKSEIVRPIQHDDGFDVVWFDKIMVACERSLHDNSHIYVFGSDTVVPHQFMVMTRYFQFKNLLVWDKGTHTAGDLDASYAKRTEFILYMRKGNKHLQMGRPDNLISVARVPAGDLLHVSQKPISLISFLIENSTKPGETVCDPFLGSGTTAVAAIKLKRKFVGYEIDKKNYDITMERVARETAQGSLF